MLKRPQRVDVLVGRNIRVWRLRRGLSQAKLGEHLDVTQQQIQLYEVGANRVGASRLSQFAAALDVPLETLTNSTPTTPVLFAQAILARAQALRLLKAFHRIPGVRTREAILRLIESVGERQSRRPRLRG
jgi:transcriptional regulator with XRE-family HTH domain